MSNDKLLARISELNWMGRHDQCFTSDAKTWRCKCGSVFEDGETCPESKSESIMANALRAVVELIQEKQMFLEETKGDIPMTSQQLGAREERTKLLAEIIQAIEKELG